MKKTKRVIDYTMNPLISLADLREVVDETEKLSPLSSVEIQQFIANNGNTEYYHIVITEDDIT